MKRTFDVIISAIGLVVFSPFALGIAALIRLDSPGPVFHRANRIGKEGKPFAMYKFRTMVVGAAQRGPGLTQGGDPRVTRVGRWLRRLKIDEVPQLINVLKGEMSVVGPRPEDPRYVARYTPAQRQVLAVRPGIVSPASLKYRNEERVLAALGGDLESTYLATVLPDKLWLDLEYIRHRSFWSDVSLLAQLAGSFLSVCGPKADDLLIRSIRSAERINVGGNGPSSKDAGVRLNTPDTNEVDSVSLT